MNESYRENFKLIDWSDLKPVNRSAPRPAAHSAFPCPRIRSDAMDPVQSMADGKIYDSKSAMSAATRRAGCYELGTDKLPPKERTPIDRAAINASLERAQARWNRGERA